MRVFITGASGFVGSRVARGFIDRGDQVLALSRGLRSNRFGVTWIVGSAAAPNAWAYAVNDCDVVVNLAGESITQRWTPERRAAIVRSRIDITRALVEVIAKASPRPRLLVSASAVGYYGAHGDETLDERAANGGGFLAAVCREWEETALAARAAGVRVVLLRLGVVLGQEGGMLARLAPVYGMGLGGPVGDGRQWLSWIHADDVAGMAVLAATDDSVEGPLNATAPTPVRQADFARAFARHLGRPALVRTPATALRLLYGEMANETLLAGQRVLPARAEQAGYAFRYPTLDEALRAP